MSDWNLPKTVEINGTEHKIRNKCDYRVILDTIEALQDEDEPQEVRLYCAFQIFFENAEELPNPLTAYTVEDIATIQEAVNEITSILKGGREDEEEQEENRKPPLIDWKHDFNNIAPPVSRVLQYSVRDEDNYTHWYDFIGAYMEIGECYFSNIISIRLKRRKGKKLDKQEEEFYREHRKEIDLKIKLTKEDEEWLNNF